MNWKKRHGMTGTPEYRAFAGMKQRCSNRNLPCWKNYGGRGISVEFRSFEEFYACVGPRPSKTATIDRIDNDGNYGPGNVRWTDVGTQANNKRNNIISREPAASIIKLLGGELTVAMVCGVALSQPHRWRKTGLIPQRHHHTVLDYAAAKGVNLTAADLLPVRKTESTVSGL